MALADITLNDGQGTPVAHVFTYTATVGGKVYRSDLGANPETPLIMVIGHQEKKVNNSLIKSHLVRFDKTVLDSDNITPYVNNIRVMCDVHTKVYSDALADDFAAFLRNYFSSANTRLLLKGSVG